MNQSILEQLGKITDEEKKILEYGNCIDRKLYMNVDSDRINANKLLESGKLITFRPHTRFVHFPEHTHDYVEVVYMCAGSTIHIVNGVKITLNAGELLFLGQGATQEILPASENDIAVNFIILPPFFDKALEMMDDEATPIRKFLVDCLGNANGSPSFFHFKVSEVPEIQNILENLIITLTGTLPNKRNICQVTMGLLFLHLLNYADHVETRSHEETSILQVLKYIDGNYRDGSLNEIANLLYYNPNYLSKEIKKRTGKTFKDFLQEKRLVQSAYLLTHTSLLIDQIAESVGYNNMSYFYKIFREKYGMNPREFRLHSFPSY